MALNNSTPASITVLIIDDEPLLRRSLADFLQDEDRFVALVAGDAEEGLEMLGKYKVNVCLVDLRLPGMNGIDFMLRAQELDPRLRFLIHTGSPEAQLPKAIIQDIPGYRGVLFKPLADMGEIIHALDRAVE